MRRRTAHAIANISSNEEYRYMKKFPLMSGKEFHWSLMNNDKE
jgi:hypothetical protein